MNEHMVIALEKQRATGFRKDKANEEKIGRSSALKKIISKWLWNLSYIRGWGYVAF